MVGTVWWFENGPRSWDKRSSIQEPLVNASVPPYRRRSGTQPTRWHAASSRNCQLVTIQGPLAQWNRGPLFTGSRALCSFDFARLWPGHDQTAGTLDGARTDRWLTSPRESKGGQLLRLRMRPDLAEDKTISGSMASTPPAFWPSYCPISTS